MDLFVFIFRKSNYGVSSILSRLGDGGFCNWSSGGDGLSEILKNSIKVLVCIFKTWTDDVYIIYNAIPAWIVQPE